MCNVIIVSFWYRQIKLQNQSPTYFQSYIETKMSSGEKKRPNSGSDRQQKYKEKNKTAVEINQLKQNLKRAKLKETDPEKAETVRLENNKRKAAQRKREKERNKENCNISAAENSDSDIASKSKSRKQEKTGARTSGSDLSDVTL